jgi:hypothetical protein
MFNPIRLYAKSQEVQLNWIRKHPIWWLALNAILAVVVIGYVQWKDNRDMQKWEAEHPVANAQD